MGTSQHNEVRTFDEEIRLLITLWSLKSGVVHISTDCGYCCAAGQPNVAIQTAFR